MSNSQPVHFNLYPIGHVAITKNQYKLQISDPYRDALLGLGDFSHAIVLWWASRCDQDVHRNLTVVNAPYTSSEKDVGVFATRSPSRPNPIAITTINLLSVDENTGIINTSFIDADHASPIIDIKPYFPASDRVTSCITPMNFNHWPKCLEDSANFDWEKEFVVV